MNNEIKKVLILGSGAIRIGQAGEFDYSGSQAIKALKEEGIKTILINPNIATIQTSEFLADEVYFLPLESHFVERVIKKEKPDGILLGFGGQTALNVGVDLWLRKFLEKENVRVLGTPVGSILKTEDRDSFVAAMNRARLKVPRSRAVETVDHAIDAADTIGYPVMLRAAYALGGLGSGIAVDEEKLKNMAAKALSQAPQILVEEYLTGWKELEYEVVRDKFDNCIVVCSMENMDPMGIHTGESIVVAPVQTLSAAENFKLRSIAIQAIRHLEIVGECNIQFAFDPQSDDYRIIEVNARLSRSSALASKATGYPLAFIAAKLSLGMALTEIRNLVTQQTYACFEPALDYVVVKFPRWDLQKFQYVHPKIGSEMKSVGEVMAIGRSFEEAFQKGIRMLNIGASGLVACDFPVENINRELSEPTDKRIFAIAEAFDQGYSVNKIHQLTLVTPWFLYKLRNIVILAKKLKKNEIHDLTPETMRLAKQHGFSDEQIAKLVGSDQKSVRELRKKMGVVPVVKQIDTLAAEFPAKTNYLYLTYHGEDNDTAETGRSGIVVLGSGPYSIGSSVEFDWCGVNAVMALQEMKYSTVIINCNPETVSTDYDICDRLYFEELSLERVLDIYEKENPIGVIVSVGGQIANQLALSLEKSDIKILGTSSENIDRAEDRHKFSALLDTLDIDQPPWEELTSFGEAKEFAKKVGYPVLIRPSYVLSGAAMSVALNEDELVTYLKKASAISSEYPVVISQFITRAKELEIDAVADHGKLFCYAISEHVENAGVHSGDATIVFPPQRTYLETVRRIRIIARKIAAALQITGPFNMQFLAKDNDVKVIECNLRASRSFPFVSKVMKINFIRIATRLIMGENVPRISGSSFDLDFVGVKAPQFSFTRLKGSDPVLGVEMVSTGEVACLGDDFNEAFLKSLLSVGFRIPQKTILLSTGPPENKADFLGSTFKLKKMGFKFYATRGTAEFMRKNGLQAEIVFWPLEKKEPNALTLIMNKKIDMVINIPKNVEMDELDNDYLIRRKAVDFNVSLITNIQLAKRFVEALYRTRVSDLKIKSWAEYI